MDQIKVKNFIILVLLIVNAVLACVFATDVLRERALASEATEGVVELLTERGISVGEDVDLTERTLASPTVSRDTDEEQRKVTNVIGTSDVTDQGGNIRLYFGSGGEAGLRGTGRVEMNIRRGAYGSGGDPLDVAVEFMRDFGMEAVGEPVSSDIDPETQEGTLTLECAYNGTSVVNCTLTFTFAEGELVGVYGTRVLDNISSGRQLTTIDVPTVLMRFVALLRDQNRVCSSLDSLELCYHMSVNAAGEGELVPVWRIVTDTGEFYINAVTGIEETIA